MQPLLLATLPLAATLLVVASTVVGVTLTLTVPPTCLGLFTPSALGTATAASATAHTEQALISFFILDTSPFIAVELPLAFTSDDGRPGDTGH